MYIEDHARKGFKIFRDETIDIKDDRKAINHGFKTTEQDDAEGFYTFVDGGGEAGWGYWKKEGTGKEITPKENSRIGNTYSYMKELTTTNQEEHLEGIWAQSIPAVVCPTGIVPIEEDHTANMKIKEIDDAPEERTNETVQTITGYNPPFGMPGIVVTSTMQDKECQYFVPTGGILSSDNEFGGLSTRIVDTKEDGYINDIATLDGIIEIKRNEEDIPIAAIKGTKAKKDHAGWGAITLKTEETEHLSYLSSERGGPLCGGAEIDKHNISEGITPAHISTDALFYMDQQKDGALKFESFLSPAVTPPAEPEYYLPAYCVYSGSSGKWRWVVPMTTAESSELIARIAWNFINGEDRSVAQTVFWDEVEEKYLPIEGEDKKIVWIDYGKSMGVTFGSAGDNTIFKLSLIKKEVTRGGITRDLYRAIHCIYDLSLNVDLAEKKEVFRNLLLCYMASSDASSFWDFDRRLRTTIDNVEIENVFVVTMPAEWLPWDEDINQWLEIMTWCEGLQSYYRPIRPALKNNSLSYDYESLEKNTDSETSISSYRKRRE